MGGPVGRGPGTLQPHEGSCWWLAGSDPERPQGGSVESPGGQASGPGFIVGPWGAVEE